ncbi:hypothetical protein PsorP6_000671 [Peronosclerospora sorghi]|uniref:Uncharacterized protein n=1 Tax=Peronosclerospora sorghi TaxID=230839 RepID=A0ACC0WQN5_9STRA|nr:hypothetical protein PsorP6_000671 [Peronosclerospora sorghi]
MQMDGSDKHIEETPEDEGAVFEETEIAKIVRSDKGSISEPDKHIEETPEDEGAYLCALIFRRV